MNAGKWIIVAFVLFVGFIATLVTVCMQQDVNLVTPDYYKKELAYQDQIDRMERTARLAVKPVVTIQRHRINIKFDSTRHIQRGSLELFCPSDSRLDRIFTLEAGTKVFVKDVSQLERGMYRLKLNWTMEGKEYYQEEIINL